MAGHVKLKHTQPWLAQTIARNVRVTGSASDVESMPCLLLAQMSIVAHTERIVLLGALALAARVTVEATMANALAPSK